MKALLLTLLVVLVGAVSHVHAGDAKLVVDAETAILPSAVTAEIEPFGVYALSSGGGDAEFGAGLGLGFTLEGLVGLEVEYLWLADTERHMAFLNGYLLIPLTESLELKPFVGGGGYGKDEVRVAAQGGVEVLQDIGLLTAVAGARYTWLDTVDGFTAFTLGFRWEF